MSCDNETSVVDGKKSFCKIWERWTNCREVSHCTYETYGKEPEQLTLCLCYNENMGMEES